MGDCKVYPFWKKSGIIPKPRMQADHINVGLLLSLLTRLADKYESGQDKEFQTRAESVLEGIVEGEIEVLFLAEEESMRVRIVSRIGVRRFGHDIFIPNSWFGSGRKTQEKTSKI